MIATIVGPHALLLDYGGTLVDDMSVDLRAGNEWLLSRASYQPPHVTLDLVLERARRVSRDVAGRRDEIQIETAWPALTRLIHDYFGTRFELPVAELEMGFWQASVHARPIPGAREALERIHRAGMTMAVVSNTSFSEPVIRYELGRHGLADHLAFIMVSSDYAVRKPDPMLFDIAAARLAKAPCDIWFVGDRLDTDIIGAKAAGMTAVWFNPGKRLDPAHTADLAVANWPELMAHLYTATGVGAAVHERLDT